MINKSFSTVSVNVPTQTLWEILVDRIVRPERYMQGILESSIIKESTEVFIRKMTTDLGEIIERIIVDVKNLVITSSFLKHPLFTGTSVNKIIETKGDTNFSLVAFERAWEPKDSVQINEDEFVGAKEALLLTKKIAESQKQESMI